MGLLDEYGVDGEWRTIYGIFALLDGAQAFSLGVASE